MNLRAVLSDVDGSLLNHNYQVCPGDDRRAELLAAHNIPLVLVSARMPAALTTIQSQLKISAPLVAFGGALVLDEHNQVLYSHTMDLGLAHDVLDFLAELQLEVTPSWYGHHIWACEKRDAAILHESEIVEVECQEIPLDEAFSHDELYKLFLMGEYDQIELALEKINERYPNLEARRSDSILCEVMPRGLSKGKGAQVIVDYLGCTAQDVACFGDALNDIELMRFSPHSYALPNGDPRLREHAQHVAPWDNDHSGVLRTALMLAGLEEA